MNPRPTRLGLCALALTLLASGCLTGSSDAPGEGLVCTAADVPPPFSRQSAGDFTPRDLADRHPDPPKRAASLRNAGMVAGYFSYWAERVDRPPFDPPAEILCQAIEFSDAASARAFVDAIVPTRAGLAATLMALLPEDVADVAEVAAPEDGLPPGTRAFQLFASASTDDLALHVLVSPTGRYVHLLGLKDVPGGMSLADALAIHRSVLDRTAAGR